MALTVSMNYGAPFTYATRQPLKYAQPNREQTIDMVLDPSTVAADSRGIKTVWAGTVLVRIKTGANAGAWGPYDSAATDGRQTLGVAPDVAICTADVNLTVDEATGDHQPVAIGGYVAFCCFNFANLTRNGATKSALQTAFPTCLFFDS